MALFDISRIENETVREQYSRALRRRDYIATSVKDAFGAHRAPIQTNFIDEDAFNAYARYSENAYVIELAKSVPLLLLLLFEKILSDPQLFPWLDAAGSTVETYAVRFIVDPVEFAGREAWDVKLTAHRSYAASKLADIMVAFIQMHELGHVLCGHVDANRQLTGSPKIAELVEVKPVSRSQLERERAWESDADSVAVTFVADHIADILKEAGKNDLAAAVFDHSTHRVEHVMSIVLVSLWAMFAYLRGARYRLRKRSNHPHPLVRTHYIKDMLIAAIRRRMTVDAAVLLELIDTRLEEMLVALQAVGLSHNHLFDDRYVRQVERQVQRIALVREKHRKLCAPWVCFRGLPPPDAPSIAGTQAFLVAMNYMNVRSIYPLAGTPPAPRRRTCARSGRRRRGRGRRSSVAVGQYRAGLNHHGLDAIREA